MRPVDACYARTVARHPGDVGSATTIVKRRQRSGEESMQITSKFTIAVHIITAIDYFKDHEKVTSNFLAGSVGGGKSRYCPKCYGQPEGSRDH